MRKSFAFLVVAVLATVCSWAGTFSTTYRVGDDNKWKMSNFLKKSTFYVVPGTGYSECVALFPGIFERKVITSDVVVTLHVAIWSDGTKPKANTFSLFFDSECKKPVSATQSGTLPTSSTFVDLVYTVSKDDATFTNDLAVKIKRLYSSSAQIRWESATIAFSYENAAPPVTLQSIAISGEPTKTAYYVGEDFDQTGLTVTANYSDESTADVTKDAVWTFDPSTITAGTTSVNATATYGGMTASKACAITIKELPKYTYTWSVNGKVAQTTVITEGEAVVPPADPEPIGGKVFIGWVTTPTVDAATAPEYATIDATAKANTTYYAVFATQTIGADKWVKKVAEEVKEGGVYALVTPSGKAFNGEIVKGNGITTTGAFEFNSENVATAAPEGTCELTFVKSENAVKDGKVGFKMLNEATGKYLYSLKNYPGNLAWKPSEDSYWYSVKAGSWFYDSNATYLSVYNNTIRTYENSRNEDVLFAQKVKGVAYTDFTTIVASPEVTALADMAMSGVEGAAYQVDDELVVARKFEAGGKHYIVVKDAAKAVRNLSTPAADDRHFAINGNKQEEYAQNNWMLVSLPVELYNQVNEKSTVSSITGTLDEKLNVAMTATNVVVGDAADFAPNTYCAINFMGESSVKGANPEYASSYYFATPKTNEFANVVWAVYNATDGAFYLPTRQGSANAQEFKAAFKVDYSLNSTPFPELKDGDMYTFEALIKEVSTTEAKPAPRKAAYDSTTAPRKSAYDSTTVPRKTAYDSTTAPSARFVVFPLNLNGSSNITTAISEVNSSAKKVKGVSYFNTLGTESSHPFKGINIVITTHTDGTTTAKKILH